MAKHLSGELATNALLQTWEQSISDLRALTDCAICSRPFYEPYIISCGHTFCFSCLEQYFNTGVPRRKTCPSCRQPVSQEPAPNYALRDITHNLISRPELLLHDETTEKHDQWAHEEASLLQRARSSSKAKMGLFGFSFGRSRAIRDTEDGVQRCPLCSWELEYGECQQCGFHDSGSDSEHADWSSMSDSSDMSSGSVSPHGRGQHIDFIDLDPSEVSFESSSAGSTVNANVGRRRQHHLGYAFHGSDGEHVDDDDEAGSLTGFVVDDENTTMRSSPSLSSDDQDLDVEPSSSPNDQSSMSPVLDATRRVTARRSLSTTLSSDGEVTQSSVQGRRLPRPPLHRGHRVLAGGSGPGLLHARRRRQSGTNPNISDSQGGNSRTAPIEIDSSSGEESGAFQDARGRATRPRVVLSNDSNGGDSGEEDTHEYDNVSMTQYRRRRPHRARIVDTDDDDEDQTASASSPARPHLRHHLRGGGHPSSGDNTPTRPPNARGTESGSATLGASSLSRHVARESARYCDQGPSRYSCYGESSSARPLVGSSSPSAPRSSALSPARHRENTDPLRGPQPTSRRCRNVPDSRFRNSETPTSTLQPSSVPSSSVYSSSSLDDDDANPAAAAESPSAPALTAHLEGLRSPTEADQTVPDSSDRACSVDSGSTQIPRSSYAQGGLSSTFSLQAPHTSHHDRRNGSRNDRQNARFPGLRFDPGSRSNGRANASPAGGDRSRLQARKQERRRAKAIRRRQNRAQNAGEAGFPGSRLESITA